MRMCCQTMNENDDEEEKYIIEKRLRLFMYNIHGFNGRPISNKSMHK